jgi:hypothetical protein
MISTEFINNLSISYTGLDFDHIIIFVAGGGLTGGKKQFQEWQENLLQYNIGSLAFDFPGINDSLEKIELTSLESRIHLTQLLVTWLQQKHNPKKISIYGHSMGGYVALGAAHHNRHINGSVILHVPAAYAQEAHDVRFGSNFTNILRKEGSYVNSYSYDWLEDITQPVTLISHSEDEIIPKDITQKYIEIGLLKERFKHIEIIGATHRIKGEENQKFLEKVFEQIKNI